MAKGQQRRVRWQDSGRKGYACSDPQITVMLFAFAGQSLSGQDQAGPDKQAVQQQVVALKQSLASNQQKLHRYQWAQATKVSIKGETKTDEQSQCRYGPDGKVQKTPIGPPPEQKEMPGGLKGRVVKKKVDEMMDYMDRLKGLVSHYAPPDPQRIQAAKQARGTRWRSASTRQARSSRTTT